MRSRQQRVYLRRRIAVLGALLLLTGAGLYLPLTLLAPVGTVEAVIDTPDIPSGTQPAITFPAYGAAGVGAIGYPGVLASGGSTAALPIASISKVVTALVVLDAMPLAVGEAGPDIVFGQADVDFYDEQVADYGSVQPVRAGQVMSERTVLDVVLITSANNYAETLATWAFGSETAFVEAATLWLAEHGLAGTVITEPTGVSPENVSTVPDLVALAKLVQEHPVMVEIVSTDSLDVAELGRIDNRNDLLGIDGIDGIKTGTLDEAGSCLLFSQDHIVGSTTVTIVGVVLGGPDHDTIDAAIRALLVEVDAGFREVELAAAGQRFASYATPWGDTAAAVASEGLSVVVWGDTAVETSVHADDIGLAGTGERVGSVTFRAGEQTGLLDLELASEIDDPGMWWRLTNPFEMF